MSHDTLPQDPESERSLLATCSAPGNEGLAADVLFELTPEDFFVPAHRAVFLGLRALLEERTEVTALTLRDVLEQTGNLARAGGYIGILELLAAEEVGRPRVLAEILVRKRKRRELIKIGARLTREAQDDGNRPEALVDGAAADLFRLAQGDPKRKGLEGIEAISDASSRRIQDRLAGEGTGGLTVGFSRLDALTQGFQPGNLIVLAARPGIGKTALALNWLLRAALRGNVGAFFSLEMSNDEVFRRLLSAHARVDLKRLEAGALDARAEAAIWRARDELRALPLTFNDDAGVTVPRIRAMVDRHLSREGASLDLVIVDYLQLLSSPEGSRAAQQNEATRIGEISRGLKLLAKDHGIPVVVLSQLNRQVEQGQGRKPQLSDLRDSGAIEQDADMVLFIHRKMKPLMDGEEPDRSAELLISKHRNGPTGLVNLYFEGEYSSYHEVERSTSGVESDYSSPGRYT